MNVSKKRLGRGLEALLTIEHSDDSGIVEVKINEVEPNLEQPRKTFDEEKLNELAKSIKKHGIVQPIIVRQENDTYKIIAGERRWRAARIAGLETINVIVKDLNDQEIIEIGLIENLQREDLNPIEEAEAYEKLMKEYGLKQEEISQIVGKSRPAIANSIRLLSLPKKIKNNIINGKISSGHGRALLPIEDEAIQENVMEEIIKMNYNVRQTENLVNNLADNNKEIKRKNKYIKSEETIELEEILKNILGTKVQLNAEKKKGKIVIEYYSNEELERIIDLLKRKTEN